MNGAESVDIRCPYCGETIAILVDTSVARQVYVEDCAVCCRPLTLAVEVGPDGSLRVDASQESG